MPLALRIFVVDARGRLAPFAKTRWSRIWQGEAVMPDRAGEDVRFLEVLVEMRPGTPLGVGRVQGLILRFDGEGRLSPAHRELLLRAAGERLGAYVNAPRLGRGVVPAGHLFVRRRQEAAQQAHWAPSAAQIAEIEALLTRSRSRR